MLESAQLIKLLLAANKQMHTVKDRANPMPCTSGLDRGKKKYERFIWYFSKEKWKYCLAHWAESKHTAF